MSSASVIGARGFFDSRRCIEARSNGDDAAVEVEVDPSQAREFALPETDVERHRLEEKILPHVLLLAAWRPIFSPTFRTAARSERSDLQARNGRCARALRTLDDRALANVSRSSAKANMAESVVGRCTIV